MVTVKKLYKEIRIKISIKPNFYFSQISQYLDLERLRATQLHIQSKQSENVQKKKNTGSCKKNTYKNLY